MRILLLGSMLLVTVLQACVPIVATGVGAGALMAADRRSAGAFVEDSEIELRGGHRIGDKFSDSHINITSYNRHVLLTGEAPSEAARGEIERTARELPGVRGVTNAITIAGNTSVTSRSNDTLITSKVKTRFLSNGNVFQPNHIKVVTENGVVYLMGVVSGREADAATEIARTTEGVQKVVRIFEYLDRTPVANQGTNAPDSSSSQVK